MRACDYCLSERGVQLCGCGSDACSTCWNDALGCCKDCAFREWDEDEDEDDASEDEGDVSVEQQQDGTYVARAGRGVDLRDVLPGVNGEVVNDAVAIFCRSCLRDLDRFELQARTIARVLPGIDHVVCVDPVDHPLFVARVHDLPRCRVVHTPEALMRIESPYLRQQAVKLMADLLISPNGYGFDTFQLDSDMYVDGSFGERWDKEVETRPWYAHEPATHERAGVARYDKLFTLPAFKFDGAIEAPWETGRVWMAPYGWWVRHDIARAARHLLRRVVYDLPRRGVSSWQDDRCSCCPCGLAHAIRALTTHARHPFSEYHLLGALTARFHTNVVRLNSPPQPLGVVHRTSADEFRELPKLLAKERGR